MSPTPRRATTRESLREPERTSPADEPKPVPTVTLTEKAYQDLLDEIARLEGPPAEPPSTCKLSGRVAGDLAHLHAEFDFQTGSRRARVALGCAQAYPTKAEIDGHPPILRWGADGLSVLVDEAGDHHLVLEMDLPLATRERGADRGLDLDLPAAVTTTLELELPPGVKKALLRTTIRGEGPLGKPPSPREVKTEAVAAGPAQDGRPRPRRAPGADLGRAGAGRRAGAAQRGQQPRLRPRGRVHEFCMFINFFGYLNWQIC